MRIAMFYHSLRSDWNHGNAHFLRGIATELNARGHAVRVYEPASAWSLANLLEEAGEDAVTAFKRVYPGLDNRTYELDSANLEQLVGDMDLVIVHEWNDPKLVARLGALRAAGGRFRLLFHDTHHRALTQAQSIASFDLSHFDGVLAFGKVIRDLYLKRGWCERAWTWHEAADIRVFRPLVNQNQEGDLVWIGNWGDDERAAELSEFIFEPAAALDLRAKVYGVRYPRAALETLDRCGIEYAGWLPNFEVPRVFARYRVTIHVPRRPYVESLPGIPTIRPFEAMACGIPLLCAPWHDSEGLFTAGRDYLVAENGMQMRRLIRDLLHDDAMATELGMHAHHTILQRHTCAHRVDELTDICRELGLRNVFRQQEEKP